MLAIALAIGVSGCAVRQPLPTPVAAAPTGLADAHARARDLLARLAERSKTLDSIQTEAVMEVTGPSSSGKSREDITAMRPARLRVEAHTPFGLAMVLAAKSDELDVYDVSHNRILRGAATAATLGRFVNIPMEPADAVALLLSIAPPNFDLNDPRASASIENGMEMVALAAPGASTRMLGFKDGYLAMVRDSDDAGNTSYEVSYADYRDIGGVMFPYLIDAKFPTAQSRVVFKLKRPIINGGAADSVFDLSPAPGVTIVDLDRATAAKHASGG